VDHNYQQLKEHIFVHLGAQIAGQILVDPSNFLKSMFVVELVKN
jgi:hypothetical protein